MKALQYGKRHGMKGFVRNRVENGSIGQLLELARQSERVVICNKTCAVVVHLGSKRFYFDCLTEVSFRKVEETLLKPYTKVYGGKLSVGRNDDCDMMVTNAETILLRYKERSAQE